MNPEPNVKRFHTITRDLHLYVGLFISPLVLLFAVSFFFLAHAWVPETLQQPVRTAGNLPIPAGVELLNGREQVYALRGVLDQLGVHGEVGFVRRISKEKRLVMPVTIPGREVSVDLNLEAQSAVVTERSNSIWNGLVYLHMMPGQHNANMRGNWLYMRVWKWLADGTVYLVLFLSISGIYLWAVLRAERRNGFALLAAGACSFFGLVYAIIR